MYFEEIWLKVFWKSTFYVSLSQACDESLSSYELMKILYIKCVPHTFSPC